MTCGLFVKPTVYSHNPSLLSILCPYNAKIHQNTSWPRMLRLLQKRRICAQCSCHIVTFHLLEEPVESNTSLHQYLLLYLLKDSQSFPETPAWSCAILILCVPTASNYISWLCPAPEPTELLFQQLRTDRKDPGAPNLELRELHLTCPMSCIQNSRVDQDFYALSNSVKFHRFPRLQCSKSCKICDAVCPCYSLLTTFSACLEQR